MIKKQTVFILGAGASFPYGYPTGPELSKLIIQMIKSNDTPNKILTKKDIILNRIVNINAIYRNASEDILKQFSSLRNALEDSSRSSIDSFLENRPEFYDIGKRCIAWNIINCENNKINNKRDWFEYLHDSELARGCNSLEEYSQNNVDFITFNYDRLLEHNIMTRVKGTYGNDYEECAEMIKDSFNIVHVHGKLDNLDWENDNGRAYGQEPISPEEWEKAAQGINIIHEKMGEEPFNEAERLIENAELIVFLGLNLHNTINLDRIHINDNLQGKRIYSTLKGLTGPQRDDIHQYFNNRIANMGRTISLQRPHIYEYGSLELLKEEVRFR